MLLGHRQAKHGGLIPRDQCHQGPLTGQNRWMLPFIKSKLRSSASASEAETDGKLETASAVLGKEILLQGKS